MEGRGYQIRPIAPRDDGAVAALIRKSLEDRGLALPGTAYTDPYLDHFSAYYAQEPDRRYFVLVDAENTVLGGAGFGRFAGFPDCAELQKLYLDDSLHGLGLGRRLLEYTMERARELGFRRMYLETHTALTEAMRLYETLGFRFIEKPDGVLHTTMNRFGIKEL